MTRSLQFIAFLVGLAVIGWIGAGYVNGHMLALIVTLAIAAFYAIGAVELWRFDRATTTLAQAVADPAAPPPATLASWLETLPAALRAPVRLRVEGERIGLPGPALAPYLTGLLVLLGMLGTFLGMVVTLNGTGIALQGASDVSSIRAALSAPVQGLGLAFGTSVAGVAASAMLGLVAALSRRERLISAQRLDACIATRLRAFSAAHHREQTFALLQTQAQGMPALVQGLQSMMTALERQSQALTERLSAGQERFHDQAAAAYTGLASSVERSLASGLADAARVAGATIQPAVEATMSGIASQTEALHTRAAELWRGALADQQRNTTEAHTAMHTALAAQEKARVDAWTKTLDATSRTLLERSEAQASATIAEIARLVQTAADAPRAAAAVINEMRDHLAASITRDRATHTERQARDEAMLAERIAHDEAQHTARIAREESTFNERIARDATETAERNAREAALQTERATREHTMLAERTQLLAAHASVLDAAHRAASEQHAAVSTLITASTAMLEQAGTRFTAHVDAHAGQLGDVAARLAGGGAEVASLGEAFGLAVERFCASNEQLGTQLQRIEGALGQSLARSDEQLAYYVAQAREVIDLSILSQNQIIEDLRQLGHRPALAGSEA